MPSQRQRSRKSKPPQQFEVVDPRWLLRAAAVAVLVALLCGYLTYCLFFWQGQWQFALHPRATPEATPATVGLPFEPVQLGVDESGTPQLAGWYIASPSPGQPTVLLLNAGDGNSGDSLGLATTLHNAGLNVLLFDYRGFGASHGPHPSELRMQHDAESAYAYLESVRAVPPQSLLVAGRGLGAAIAVNLCARHARIAALLLEDPAGDVTEDIANDKRTRLLPVHLLLHERFALAAPLAQLSTPKLLITTTGSGSPPAFARAAADPKMTVELAPNDAAAYQTSLRRFLDEYVQQPPAMLTPMR